MFSQVVFFILWNTGFILLQLTPCGATVLLYYARRNITTEMSFKIEFLLKRKTEASDFGDNWHICPAVLSHAFLLPLSRKFFWGGGTGEIVMFDFRWKKKKRS